MHIGQRILTDLRDLCTILIGDLLIAMAHHNRHSFAEVPDSSFQQLEKQFRSTNRGNLIERGMDVLSDEAFLFTFPCLLHYPGKLCRTAKLLGTLSRPVRYDVISRFSQHALFDIGSKSMDEIIAELERHTIADNPVPKKLRLYRNNEVNLSDAQLRRMHTKLKIDLYATQLDLLDSMIRETLTKTWWSRHPEVPLSAWINGIPFKQTTASHGSIHLHIEQDPLEALKLGTYVGSCLGAGGDYAFSAAAVVLDENKQVLYARNAEGKVIARQTLAISEEHQLVCFTVYPENIDTEIQLCFLDYNTQLSAALNLPIFDYDQHEEYTIAHILSRDWWDDYPWQ